MFDFLLPDLGEGIHEAEVLQVKVAEGDTVKEDQAIFEVETDKAVVEIPSPKSGKIAKVHVTAGQVVKVGMVMVSYGEGGATQKTEEKPAAKSSAAATGAGAAKEREAGSSKIESRAGAGSVAAPTMTPPAPTNGKASVAHSSATAPGSVNVGPVAAAPATRRLARELGIDIRLIQGSGPAGRVSTEDVRSFAAGSLESTMGGATKSRTTEPAAKPAQPVSLASKYGAASGERDNDAGGGQSFSAMTAQPSELPDFSKYGPIERIPLKSIRKKIAQNMMMAWTHVPHVTTFDEADVTDLDALRAKHEDEVKKQGGRLTLTVFALKAIASGLKKYPQFNASLDERSGELIFKHYINLGVAVATERGLIVPVIKDVDKKGIIELCVELQDIAEKTRAGKIEIDRLQGGTFTLTNIGSIGGTSMSPMVNYPECAILGMARAAQKPVVRNNNIEIGLIMPLALSFDHRIADGAEAAYFVQHIVKRLQNPFTFLLEA